MMVFNQPDHKRIARFEAATGKVRWVHKTNFMHGVTVSPDGRTVLYRGLDVDEKYPDHWHWLDAATGKPTGTVLAVDNPNAWVDAPVYFDRLTYAVVWHPDGSTIALAGQSGLIAQWDLKERKRLPASAEPLTQVTELYVTPDGTKVRGWARGWYEWDVKSGKQARLTPELGLAPSERFVISRDLKWLARVLPGNATAVEIVDLANRERKHLLKDAPEGVYPYFLKDGRLAIAFPDANCTCTTRSRARGRYGSSFRGPRRLG